ncbi:MAG: helicase-associated domain-containing protein [Ornithinimicrobium sp.]
MPASPDENAAPVARSLADDLRQRSDDALARLLIARPDLARPAPSDVTTLAARANTKASTQRALDGLDLAHLHTLEAALVASPADVDSIGSLLGESAATADVTALVDDLIAVALIWRSSEGLHVARAAADALGDPAGLGPTVPGAPSGAAAREALTHLDRHAQAILDALTWGPPTGVLSRDPDAAPGSLGASGLWLTEHNLLQRLDSSHVVLPRQVALELRGGRLHRETALRAPLTSESANRVDIEIADAAAGGRAAELLVLSSEIIETWGANPPRVLRTGGLAVRDLNRLAAHLEINTTQASWLLEVMHAAGLIARDDSGETASDAWMPTGDADDWSEESPERRWAGLAHAWLTMTAAPSLVGNSESGRINVLSTETSWPAGRQRRRDVMHALASMPVGLSPDPDAIVELLRWHHPIRMQRASAAGNSPAVAVVQREAEWAGVLGRGALSTPGRSMITDGSRAAEAAMNPHIPAAVDHVLLQADLTAIAPGRLDGPAQSVMRLVSDVESRGGATVYRITESTLRRSLDAGWSADRLLSEIAAISRTGIPQPLEYLVRDVARRHGVARVGACSAYVRSDDEALLDRVQADRSLAMLQLRRIAATVLISPVPAPTVLDLLREEQYGPIAEGTDGGVSLAPGRYHRTTRRTAPAVSVSTVDPGVAAHIVSSLRHGESVREAHEHGDSTGVVSSTDPVLTASLLRESAAEGSAVWVGYVDDVGGVQRMLIRPHRVEGGRVRASVGDGDQVRTLLLHRITGARPAT